MDPITVALQSKGVNEVKAALRGVHEAIEQIDKVSASAGKNAFASRLRGIKKELGSGQGGASGGGSARASMSRALGGDSGSGVRRSFSGPSLAEMPGSSGTSGMMSMIGKAGAAGAAFAILKGGIDFAADALKQFGGFLISDVIKPAFALETRAQQVANASGGAMTGGEIEAKSRSIAISHNMDPMEMLSAAELINDAIGDLKGSFDLLDTVGTLAKARGADTSQLAQFAAELRKLDPNASAEQISGLLMTQLAQGDKGSVPLKEAARLGGRLTAPAAVLAGNTDVRMAAMGALMQTGRKGFGSTDELATAMGNLISEVSSQKMVGSDKYLGRDDHGNVTSIIQDIPALIAGILGQTGGNAKKIGALGLSDPASKLVKAYLPTFNEAGKGDKGKEAVEKLIRGFMEASTSLESEKANERKVLQTSGEKWSAAIEGIKNKMLDVMPEVQKLVDSLSKKGPEIGAALTTIAKALVSLAQFINKWFGGGDENTNEATGESRGEYKINPETGQFEYTKQSDLNDANKANPFSDKYEGDGFQFKGFDGKLKEGEPAANPLLSDGTQPAAVPSLMFNWQAPKDAPAAAGAPKADQSLAQLDALGPKANALGLMFDKLTASGNDLARNKPLGQR